jgi:hypothetical protein
VPGSEIQKPLAAVVIGSMSLTLLTLFILPTLYNVFDRASDPIPRSRNLSTIHLAHHDVDATENHHHVGDGVPETHVFEDR